MTKAILLSSILSAVIAFEPSRLLGVATTSNFVFFSVISLFLLLIAGLMSGLTVGMMGISELELELKLVIGTADEKKQARKLLPIIHHHHMLLVTLLLANAIAAETLPIILSKIVSETLAIALSILLVLIFGEVVPMAICTGPDQLEVAAKCAGIVRFLICLLFPITWPVSLMLDCLFREDYTPKEEEEKNLITGKTDDHDLKDENVLTDVQLRLIHSAIRSREEVVSRRMVPLDKVYCIDSTTVFNLATLQEIHRLGFSRIPIYTGKEFVGILETKRLLFVRPDDNLTLEQAGIPLEQFAVTDASENMVSLLYLFRSKKIHVALISTDPLGSSFVSDKVACESVKGFVTIESILSFLTNISEMPENAAGTLPFSHKRLSRASSSMKKESGHFRYLPSAAGIALHGQRQTRLSQSLYGARSLRMRPNSPRI